MAIIKQINWASKQTTGLIGFWDFEDGGAYDKSLKGNHGTLINAPVKTEFSIGKTLSFNGTDQAVTIPSTYASKNIAITFWAKKSDSSNCSIIGTGDSTTSAVQRINIHLPYDSVIYWDYGLTASGGRISKAVPSDFIDVWHHWAFQAENGEAMSIYLDGVLWASGGADSSGYTGTTSLGIGAFNTSGVLAGHFKGQIGAVRMYNRALKNAEVWSIYNNAKDIYVKNKNAAWFFFPETATALTGSAASTATATGAITATTALTGSAAATATATGAITATTALTGSAAAAATATGAITATTALTGSAASTATAIGALDSLSANALAGNASSIATTTGALIAQVAMTGAATARATATGALGQSGLFDLAGSAIASATATGSLTPQALIGTTTTAADIIILSLRDLGVLDENETPSAALMADCLTTLNQMLSLWSLQKVYIYAKQLISFPATGAQSYTIGDGGVVNVTAPQIIDSALYRVGDVDYPIKKILNTFAEYLSIPVKNTTGYPDALYFNPTHPLGAIFVYPVPSSGTIILSAGVELPNYALAADNLNLPLGCELVVRLNLSVFLAGMGLGRLQLKAVERAKSALNSYKRGNSQIGESTGWNDRKPYNILTNQ